LASNTQFCCKPPENGGSTAGEAVRIRCREKEVSFSGVFARL
jgi:hypothetical protein